MEYQEGYVYHISDDYFKLVQDNKLMQNKEGGNYRPTFFCIRDSQTSLLWMIPISTRYEKFEGIYNKDVQRYGQCIKIVLGEFDGVPAAFLLQNMFPVTEKYLNHVHTRNGNPVPVKPILRNKIQSNYAKLRQLIARGAKVVFPDVLRLEKLMIDELAKDMAVKAPTMCKMIVAEKPEATKWSCEKRDAAAHPPNPEHKPPTH